MTTPDTIVREALLLARTLRPYYGRALNALAVRLRPGLGTVAVDRHWRLYVDPDWLATLSPVEQATVLAAHEVEHLLRRHDRMSGIGVDRRAINIAGDVEINDDIGPNESLPPNCVCPGTFGWPEHLLAEQYLALMDDPPPVSGCGGGSGAGVPIEEEEGIGSDGLDEASAERVRHIVAADVRAYVAAHGRGSVPRGVRVWADALLTRAVIDWREVLAVLMGRLLRECKRGRHDYSWKIPHRRQGAVLRPGMADPIPLIGMAVDTSGSMGAETACVALTVTRSFGKTIIAQGDVVLSAPLASRLPSEWRGGGGSDLRPLIKSLLQRRPDLIVVVTDSDTEWPHEPPPVPVVVLALGNEPIPAWAISVDVRSALSQ